MFIKKYNHASKWKSRRAILYVIETFNI